MRQEIMAQNQNQDCPTPEQLSPANNLVVRIDQDSDSDLQALFDTVLNPDAKRQQQVPLRLRNLPSSFFKPPSNGSKSSSVSHSRDNSADSAFDSGSASGAHQVVHSRAHSSPASLQQTYAMGQQQNLTSHHHSKQRSYDSINLNDQIPLPPGWEQARTAEGQIYYLNHITCTTTWEDPRKTGQINQHQILLNPQDIRTQNIIPPNLENKSSTLTELPPLPYGWEQSTTAEGEIYFINHQTRTTSWFDPRIPVHLQRSPVNGVLPMMNAISSQEQVTQQKMRLQMLQLERERLKQRQEEIRRQQGMMMPTNPTMDSYLSDLAEHSRQESADSGLGMGTATNVYPISDSPDDFLANITNVIDHMDCASEEVIEEFPNVTLDDVQSLINPSATPPEMATNVNDLTWL